MAFYLTANVLRERPHLPLPETLDTPKRMRKYLDIPLTLAVALMLTVAMLWPEHRHGQHERHCECEGYVEVLAHPFGCI